MAMKEIELSYKALFDIIALEENISHQLNREYFQKTPIQILDEHHQWIDVKGLISKKSNTYTLELDGTNYLKCADKHLIMTTEGLKNVDELIHGDTLITGDGDDVHVSYIEKNDTESTVYDIEVDSETHLYQIANGTIHHNTLLTAAIVKHANMLNMRSITIVPSSSLLKQTYDYIKQFEIPVGMFGGGKKEDEVNMVATWQTLQNNKQFIRDFECIIWDEAHGAKAFLAQQIMNEATNSYIRVGLTGTIPKDPLDKANLTAAFGPVIYDVKAKQLQDRNILSSIDINIFELEYPKEYVNSFVDWQDETVFLQSNEMYHEVMKALVSHFEGNTLILMKNIDPAEELAEVLGCTYISSKFTVEKRQEKFNEFTYGSNHIAVGTYSLLSTGIDIVHINNLILAPTPGKSFTKVIQSIGRGLRRKSGQKEHVTVVDLTSNLKFDKKHIKSRKDFYKEAQYPFEEDTIEVGQYRLKDKTKKNKK